MRWDSSEWTIRRLRKGDEPAAAGMFAVAAVEGRAVVGGVTGHLLPRTPMRRGSIA